MSYLTTPIGTLQAQVAAALEGEGFPYNPLRMSWGQYLATALGEPNAYLHKSHAQMLSEIDAQYGGSLSYLRASVAQLLDDVAANIGAGGGGEPYVADAVVFDPSTQLVNAAATATDTGLWSFSLWFKTPALPGNEQFWFGVTQADASTTPGVSFPSNGPGAQEVSVYSYSADLTYGYQAGNQFSTIEGAWHHMLFSGDMASPQAQQYLDDVPQRDLDPDFVLHSGFLPGGALTINGRKWIFGGFDDPISFPREVTIEFADVWIAFGTSLLDGSGNIPEATRRKFIGADGKPADPSGFPAGDVLFTGNAAAFAANQGSAGAFAVTGAITNASTSPSD